MFSQFSDPIPVAQVPLVPPEWDSVLPDRWDWHSLESLGAFSLWNGSRAVEQPTTLRLCASADEFFIRFECADRDIWGTYPSRDMPLYEEEVVEAFLAPGGEDPLDYYEFEVSPLGVLFDARVHNPGNRRHPGFTVDLAWDCNGVRWWAGIEAGRQSWWAVLGIPWRSLCPYGDIPAVWRANFYRIERPRDGLPEYSGWSPTLTPEPDFHVSARFGLLTVSALLKPA